MDVVRQLPVGLAQEAHVASESLEIRAVRRAGLPRQHEGCRQYLRPLLEPFDIEELVSGDSRQVRGHPSPSIANTPIEKGADFTLLGSFLMLEDGKRAGQRT